MTRAGDHFYVGLSDRFKQRRGHRPAARASACGLTVEGGDASVLHLKTGATTWSGATLLVAGEFQTHPAFSGFNRIPVPDEGGPMASTASYQRQGDRARGVSAVLTASEAGYETPDDGGHRGVQEDRRRADLCLSLRFLIRGACAAAHGGGAFFFGMFYRRWDKLAGEREWLDVGLDRGRDRTGGDWGVLLLLLTLPGAADAAQQPSDRAHHLRQVGHSEADCPGESVPIGADRHQRARPTAGAQDLAGGASPLAPLSATPQASALAFSPAWPRIPKAGAIAGGPGRGGSSWGWRMGAHCP